MSQRRGQKRSCKKVQRKNCGKDRHRKGRLKSRRKVLEEEEHQGPGERARECAGPAESCRMGQQKSRRYGLRKSHRKGHWKNCRTALW